MLFFRQANGWAPRSFFYWLFFYLCSCCQGHVGSSVAFALFSSTSFLHPEAHEIPDKRQANIFLCFVKHVTCTHTRGVSKMYEISVSCTRNTAFFPFLLAQRDKILLCISLTRRLFQQKLNYNLSIIYQTRIRPTK